MATYSGIQLTVTPATTTTWTNTWTQWVRIPYGVTITSSTASTCTIRDNHVWDQWRNVGYTTNAIAWQEPVWEAWIDEAADFAEVQRQHDELQARREQQSRERLAREQALVENRLVAHARALELLDDLLTPEERVVREEQGRVEIEGSDGHLYRIEMHRETVHGNIVRIDEHGCSLGRACVAPRMYSDDGMRALPTADGWVGQYLGLKFDAERFLSHANWSGRRDCREQAAA